MSSQSTLETLIAYAIAFINNFLVPFVFAVAFAFFLWGMLNFFFLKQKDPKAREEGRGFMIGGIVAFAVMLSVWGLVNLVRGSIPFTSISQPDLPTFKNTSGSPSQQQPATIPATNKTQPATIPATNKTQPATIPASNQSSPASDPFSSNPDYDVTAQ